MVEIRENRNRAIVMVQKFCRSHLFWKRGVLKRMQIEKLEINNQYWEKIKEKQRKDVVREIESLIVVYIERKRENERRLSKTRTFWGLTKKVKQILKDYLRFQNKNRNPNKKKGHGHGFRRVRPRESRANLDISSLHSNLSEKNDPSPSSSNHDDPKFKGQQKFAPSKFKKEVDFRQREQDVRNKDFSISQISNEQESVSNVNKSKRSSKVDRIEIIKEIESLKRNEEEKSDQTVSEINPINEPNLIVDPNNYLDPEKRTLDTISENIMKEHIIHEKVAQDRERMRQKRKCTKIQTFNPIQMEKEMVTPLPGYLQPTTSQLIKEILVDDQVLDQFKAASNKRVKTSKGTKRNDLNEKVDLAEFILSHRSNGKSLKENQKIVNQSKSTRVLPKYDVGEDQNNLIFNKEILTPQALERAEILNDIGLIYEVLTDPKK